MSRLNPDTMTSLARWFFDPVAPPPPGFADRTFAARWCFEQLFFRPPPLELDEIKSNVFDGIVRAYFHRSPPQTVPCGGAYPKHEFLRYLVDRKRYVLHGSKDHPIDQLEPQPQRDWNGKPMTAVFGSRDGIWPMFFAVLNRQAVRGSIRNGGFVVGEPMRDGERFYFFSVGSESLWNELWSDGVVYVLSGESFAPTSTGSVRFDEWASHRSVPIVARIPVTPDDFPFRGHVTRHQEDEPVYVSWLRFKERQQGFRDRSDSA